MALATWHLALLGFFYIELKNYLKPVWNQFGTGSNIKSKNLIVENLLKTSTELVLNLFLSVATFWANFVNSWATLLSNFLADLPFVTF